jgi:hypothetical protein
VLCSLALKFGGVSTSVLLRSLFLTIFLLPEVCQTE